MFIETVPNRDSPPAVLLRESYRDEAGKSQKRTLANLSKLPAAVVAGAEGVAEGRHGIGAARTGSRSSGRCRTAMSQRHSARCARWRSTG